MIEVDEVHRFQTAADLRRLVPQRLSSPFHTLHLAEAMDVDRWLARKVAYCLRNIGTITPVGKKGNSLLYEFSSTKDVAA